MNKRPRSYILRSTYFCLNTSSSVVHAERAAGGQEVSGDFRTTVSHMISQPIAHTHNSPANNLATPAQHHAPKVSPPSAEWGHGSAAAAEKNHTCTYVRKQYLRMLSSFLISPILSKSTFLFFARTTATRRQVTISLLLCCCTHDAVLRLHVYVCVLCAVCERCVIIHGCVTLFLIITLAHRPLLPVVRNQAHIICMTGRKL